MKRVILILCFMAGVTTYAQSGTGIGFKGGANFGASDDLTKNITNLSEDFISKLGFHIGVFGQMQFDKLYIRPELVYTRLNAKVNRQDFNIQKLDLPILVGYQVFGPVHVFVGPSFQYLLDSELEEVNYNDIKSKFTVGFQIGAGVNLTEQLGLDLRYERGFGKNVAEFIGSDEVARRMETRPTQLALSLSYMF